MVASPRSGEGYSQGQEREASYEELAVLLSPEELCERMSAEEARDIVRLIENAGNLGQAVLSEGALECRYNRQLYDDPVEDYIFESKIIDELISTMRQTGRHEDAEKVRLLRSARARIFFETDSETTE